jgi:hypothetical protein
VSELGSSTFEVADTCACIGLCSAYQDNNTTICWYFEVGAIVYRRGCGHQTCRGSQRQWFRCCSVTTAVEAPISHAASPATDSNVTLNFNGKEEKLRLINKKIQMNAVKEAFNLKTVQLNGQLEPVDQLGFTVAEYSPGQTIMVSGSPVAGTCRAASLYALLPVLPRMPTCTAASTY